MQILFVVRYAPGKRSVDIIHFAILGGLNASGCILVCTYVLFHNFVIDGGVRKMEVLLCHHISHEQIPSNFVPGVAMHMFYQNIPQKLASGMKRVHEPIEGCSTTD